MEKWVKISGYSQYSISNLGRVRNDITNTIKTNTIARRGNTSYYVTRMINDEGIQKNELVHRLIAKAFIPNDDPHRDCINHIDGNGLNNNLDNLEWCTKAENNRHAYRTGLANTEKPVQSINIKTNEIKSYKSARDASRKTGICYKQISDTCNGRQHTSHGYYWKFI